LPCSISVLMFLEMVFFDLPDLSGMDHLKENVMTFIVAMHFATLFTKAMEYDLKQKPMSWRPLRETLRLDTDHIPFMARKFETPQRGNPGPTAPN
jgi:hypothetical protein